MTKQELSQCYWLTRKIEQLKKELQEMEGNEFKSINLTDMPSGGGISNHVAKIATQRAELYRMISIKIEECMIVRSRIERYIDTIEDDKVQEIIRLRHVNGLKWGEIATYMDNSDRHVRRLYYDFLKNNEMS